MTTAPMEREAGSSLLQRLAGPAVTVAAAAVLLGFTWGAWPDVIVDFGRELYVPWQLGQGKVLYRDIAYFNGPLSPSLNALWFALFGTGLRTLVLCNLAILAAVVAMLNRLLVTIAGRIPAAAAGIVFVTLFAFGQLIWVGNFNYVCPYSHELTHGIALALAALVCLDGFQRSGRTLWALGSGLAAGLAFLTKAEIFLAVAASMAAGYALTLVIKRSSTRRTGAVGGVIAGGALLPPLLAWFLLARHMPAREALRGTLGSWPWVLAGEVPNVEFFRIMAGWDHAAAGLGLMAAATAAFAIVLGAAFFVDRAIERSGAAGRPASRVTAAVVFVGLSAILCLPIASAWGGSGPPAGLFEGGGIWANAFRPLPLLVAAIAVAGARRALRRPRTGREEGGESARSILAVSFAVMALVLLLKLLLNAHIYAYGFAHAMPATMLLVVFLTGWLPRWARERTGLARVTAAAGGAFVVGAVIVHLSVTAFWTNRKTFTVGRGQDAFRTDARGPEVQACIEEIARLTGPRETLAVFPEGVMVNYLTRRANPSPYLNFIPPELLIFDQRRMVTALETHPPDYALIVHRPTPEYGTTNFGLDYGGDLYAWLQKDYELAKTFGAQPFSGRSFGIFMLRRRPGTA